MEFALRSWKLGGHPHAGVLACFSRQSASHNMLAFQRRPLVTRVRPSARRALAKAFGAPLRSATSPWRRSRAGALNVDVVGCGGTEFVRLCQSWGKWNDLWRLVLCDDFPQSFFVRPCLVFVVGTTLFGDQKRQQLNLTVSDSLQTCRWSGVVSSQVHRQRLRPARSSAIPWSTQSLRWRSSNKP